MADVVPVEGLVLHVEVQKGDGVHVAQLEVPVRTLASLLPDGERGVEQRAVLEELLVGVLHLDDELLAVLTLAIYVEYCLPVGIEVADMLVVHVHHVLHHLCAVEQAVEEAYQEVLVRCSAEYALEAEVRQQAYVSVLYCLHNTNFSAKMQKISETAK